MPMVLSIRLPLVVETFLPNPGDIRYTLVVMSTRLPLVVMMCAVLLCMTGRVDNLPSNPREVGYLLVWKTIRLELVALLIYGKFRSPLEVVTFMLGV